MPETLLLVFVRFPDDRRLFIIIRVVVVLVLIFIVVVIVGISRRRQVAHKDYQAEDV
jgi:hypothetical protein